MGKHLGKKYPWEFVSAESRRHYRLSNRQTIQRAIYLQTFLVSRLSKIVVFLKYCIGQYIITFSVQWKMEITVIFNKNLCVTID